jgi:hypothetical protein
MLILLKKLLLVVVALGIAAAVTYYPWTLLGDMPGNEGYAYFLASVVWAPAMLVLGVVAGFVFAWVLWPRKQKANPPPPPSTTNFEA